MKINLDLRLKKLMLLGVILFFSLVNLKKVKTNKKQNKIISYEKLKNTILNNECIMLNTNEYIEIENINEIHKPAKESSLNESVVNIKLSTDNEDTNHCKCISLESTKKIVNKYA